MQRRQFLIQTAKASAMALGVTGAGIWLAGRKATESDRVFAIPDYSIPQDRLTRNFVVVRGTNPAAMVTAGMTELGGIGKFISPGDRVLVKPNVGFDRPSFMGATTSPEVTGAVVRAVLAAGAARVVVSDNPINSPAASFGRSGIGTAVAQAGGEVRYLSENDFRETHIGGVALGQFTTAAALLGGVDKVIGLPTLKDHNLSGMSFAMKNWYGLLGLGRNRFHQDIQNVIADLAFMIKPTLVIGDATRILTKNGPTGGSPSDVKPGGTLIFSTDAVAVDAFGREMLKRSADICRYIQLAADRGIGTSDYNSLGYMEVHV